MNLVTRAREFATSAHKGSSRASGRSCRRLKWGWRVRRLMALQEVKMAVEGSIAMPVEFLDRNLQEQLLGDVGIKWVNEPPTNLAHVRGLVAELIAEPSTADEIVKAVHALVPEAPIVELTARTGSAGSTKSHVVRVVSKVVRSG